MAKLADKIALLKARLKDLEAEQKREARALAQAQTAKDRKAENQRKYELGGLVKLAGLHDTDRGALLGALLSLAPLLADPQQADAFKHVGDELLARRERERKPPAPAVAINDEYLK